MLKMLVLSLFFVFSFAEKPRKAIIAIEMCMCGSVKWNRAKNFALDVAKKFDTIPSEIDYNIGKIQNIMKITVMIYLGWPP